MRKKLFSSILVLCSMMFCFTTNLAADKAKATSQSAIVEVQNEYNFKQAISKKGLVLVDFYATWCGPCKMMHPTIEEISVEKKGKLKVLKVDVDQNKELAVEYNIRSIPTFMLFKDGKQVWSKTGAMPKADMKAIIEQYQ
ncbi:MAG: thioredoxin [Bacteroidales bacterium]|nr:thioredoxin [Bacteroidales bacterium]